MIVVHRNVHWLYLATFKYIFCIYFTLNCMIAVRSFAYERVVSDYLENCQINFVRRSTIRLFIKKLLHGAVWLKPIDMLVSMKTILHDLCLICEGKFYWHDSCSRMTNVIKCRRNEKTCHSHKMQVFIKQRVIAKRPRWTSSTLGFSRLCDAQSFAWSNRL